MKHEEYGHDKDSSSGDSADDSLDVNALMNMLHDIKRTKLHNKNTVEWLRKRFNNKTKLKYLYFPEEVLEQENIKNIFDTFDDNNNQILEMSEMLEMFKQYNIKMTKEDLEEFFVIVDEDNDRALNFKEFKNCALSEKANNAFFRIMRRIREKEERKAKTLVAENEGKRINSELNALKKNDHPITNSLVTYNKEGDGLRAGGPMKRKIKKIKTPLEEGLEPSLNASEGHPDGENELSYLPVSFGGMVSFLSYKVLREKLLKSIQEGGLGPKARVDKLFELFRLSKIYQKDEEERKERQKYKGPAGKKPDVIQQIKRKTARMSAIQNFEEIPSITGSIGAKRSSAYYNSNLYNELRKRGVSVRNSTLGKEKERPDSVLQATHTIEEEVSTIVSKAKETSVKYVKDEKSFMFSNNKSKNDSLILPELESPRFFMKEKIMFMKSESTTSKLSVNSNGIPRKLREINKLMQEGVQNAKDSVETRAFRRIIKKRNKLSLGGLDEEWKHASKAQVYRPDDNLQEKKFPRNVSLPFIKRNRAPEHD